MPRNYQRKTRDVYDIQGDYGQGFEIVSAETTRPDARRAVREYRENEPGIPFRIKKTRERIERKEV